MGVVNVLEISVMVILLAPTKYAIMTYASNVQIHWKFKVYQAKYFMQDKALYYA